MNFEFFESMSRAEAESFLVKFLELGAESSRELIQLARVEGVGADFGLDSISPFFVWALKWVSFDRKDPDQSLPSWIRDTNSYAVGLFDFDESSRPLVFACAYYLGESFVRASQYLRWGVGDPEFAQQNQPVVTGFGDGIEMPPLLVTGTLFRKIKLRGASQDIIAQGVQWWFKKVR